MARTKAKQRDRRSAPPGWEGQVDGERNRVTLTKPFPGAPNDRLLVRVRGSATTDPEIVWMSAVELAWREEVRVAVDDRARQAATLERNRAHTAHRLYRICGTQDPAETLIELRDANQHEQARRLARLIARDQELRDDRSSPRRD